MKLYEILDSITKLFSENTDMETGEISPKAYEEISNLEVDAIRKVHSCGNKIREISDKVESISILERKLKKEKKILKNDMKSLEGYTAFYMKQLGIKEVHMDGLRTQLKELPDDIAVDINALLESAPEFCKVVSHRAMIRELKNHIKNGGKVPHGVKVITNRLSLKL